MSGENLTPNQSSEIGFGIDRDSALKYLRSQGTKMGFTDEPQDVEIYKKSKSARFFGEQVISGRVHRRTDSEISVQLTGEIKPGYKDREAQRKRKKRIEKGFPHACEDLVDQGYDAILDRDTDGNSRLIVGLDKDGSKDIQVISDGEGLKIIAPTVVISKDDSDSDEFDELLPGFTKVYETVLENLRPEKSSQQKGAVPHKKPMPTSKSVKFRSRPDVQVVALPTDPAEDSIRFDPVGTNDSRPVLSSAQDEIVVQAVRIDDTLPSQIVGETEERPQSHADYLKTKIHDLVQLELDKNPEFDVDTLLRKSPQVQKELDQLFPGWKEMSVGEISQKLLAKDKDLDPKKAEQYVDRWLLIAFASDREIASLIGEEFDKLGSGSTKALRDQTATSSQDEGSQPILPADAIGPTETAREEVEVDEQTADLLSLIGSVTRNGENLFKSPTFCRLNPEQQRQFVLENAKEIKAWLDSGERNMPHGEGSLWSKLSNITPMEGEKGTPIDAYNTFAELVAEKENLWSLRIQTPIPGVPNVNSSQRLEIMGNGLFDSVLLNKTPYKDWPEDLKKEFLNRRTSVDSLYNKLAILGIEVGSRSGGRLRSLVQRFRGKVPEEVANKVENSFDAVKNSSSQKARKVFDWIKDTAGRSGIQIGEFEGADSVKEAFGKMRQFMEKRLLDKLPETNLTDEQKKLLKQGLAFGAGVVVGKFVADQVDVVTTRSTAVSKLIPGLVMMTSPWVHLGVAHLRQRSETARAILDDVGEYSGGIKSAYTNLASRDQNGLFGKFIFGAGFGVLGSGVSDMLEDGWDGGPVRQVGMTDMARLLDDQGKDVSGVVSLDDGGSYFSYKDPDSDIFHFRIDTDGDGIPEVSIRHDTTSGETTTFIPDENGLPVVDDEGRYTIPAEIQQKFELTSQEQGVSPSESVELTTPPAQLEEPEGVPATVPSEDTLNREETINQDDAGVASEEQDLPGPKLTYDLNSDGNIDVERTGDVWYADIDGSGNKVEVQFDPDTGVLTQDQTEYRFDQDTGQWILRTEGPGTELPGVGEVAPQPPESQDTESSDQQTAQPGQDEELSADTVEKSDWEEARSKLDPIQIEEGQSQYTLRYGDTMTDVANALSKENGMPISQNLLDLYKANGNLFSVPDNPNLETIQQVNQFLTNNPNADPMTEISPGTNLYQALMNSMNNLTAGQNVTLP